MPHTNRKKKYSVSLDADGKLSKQIPSKKYTRSKRELVETSDGWTQVASSSWKTAKTHSQSHLHTDGPGGLSPQVLDISLDELREGYERYRKIWEDSQACAQLKALLAEDKAAGNGKRVPDNVVCLGLGSLHTVSLVWRRTSCTQLAALETVREVLNLKGRAIMQDPHFTNLDISFLNSLKYEVVQDPEAFGLLDAGSLIYAIHCEKAIYVKIQESTGPALLIGNNLQDKLTVSNFTSFIGPDNATEESLPDAKSRESQLNFSLAEEYDKILFPQLDNYFSDTVIYWRHSHVPEPNTEPNGIGYLGKEAQ